MPGPSRPAPVGPSLVRRLGPFDGASIIVSNVIGSGVFLVPVLIAQWVPNVWAMLALWLTGGLLVFAGAMAYAELAALRPRAGAEYVYLREAFGPAAGFLTGWTSFVAGFSGAIATAAVGLAEYLGRFVPAAADTTALAHLPLGLVTLTLSPQALVALAVIGALTAVHAVGLGPGRVVQNILATGKVAVLVALVVFGFTVGEGSTTHFTAPAGSLTPSLWLLGLIPVMFAYSGWNAAAYVAEEIRAPGRNLPLATAAGTVAVVVVYLALNALYVYAMPLAEIAAVDVRVVDAAGRPALRGGRGRTAGRGVGGDESRRPSARWCWPVRASTSRWRATASSSPPRRACTRGSARR